MSNRLRFQKQHSAQSEKPSSTTIRNGNGAKPQTTTEKTIQTDITTQPPREDVSAIAYQIYLQEGRPQGRDLQHWLEAEAQLAGSPPVTVKTELTVKTETTVTNEVGIAERRKG